MTAPTIDAVAPATPAPTTASTTTAPVPSQAESRTRSTDLLTFKIGLGIVAAVVLVMAAVGAVVGSSALLIASGFIGAASALTGVYTGVNLLDRTA